MKSSGESLENKLKRKNQKFIQIEMLVVKREYQNKGYMRKLIQIAFDKADELGIPCIVSTDGVLKMQKYSLLYINMAKHSLYQGIADF